MIFHREISRIEQDGIRLAYSVQSNPFEYELHTPPVPTRFTLAFPLPVGLHVTEFTSLTELPELAKLLSIDLTALARVNPGEFARMASSMDDSLIAPLAPPEEWVTVLEYYQASPGDVSPEEWEQYHAAQRAFETEYWPPRVHQGLLSWVSTQLRGNLLGVRLDLSSMRLEKVELP
ncbi:MAG: hypothetical protein JNM27_03360 [Leptospirales bacterium]|nr:hypothetical protein [Leptospirales bacterium]